MGTGEPHLEPMAAPIHKPNRRWQPREARFLGLVALTALSIGLYLERGLTLAAREGGGHRIIDIQALQRRIDSGDLREREAQWYHPTRPEEENGRNRGTTP